MTNKNNEDAAIPTPKINRFPFLDNIHTTVFTPSEFQVEVLDAAREKNIVMCLATISSKSFIVVMLVKEFSCQVRSQSVKRCWVLANDVLMVQQYFDLINDHTSLELVKLLGSRVTTNNIINGISESVSKITHMDKVVVTLVDTFLEAVDEGLINFNEISLLIIDECHFALTRQHYKRLMTVIPHAEASESPRIVGLSISVLDHNCDPDVLEKRLLVLEQSTKCISETSSNLMVLSRFSSRPEEIVVVCDNMAESDVDREIRDAIMRAKSFLEDHIYRPEDIYGLTPDEDFFSIPDPAVIPLSFLSDMLDILDTLGPFCADRAAWFFMKELKKLRDKVPYERQYLLISVVFTTMETIRAICDFHFHQVADEKQRMIQFVTPKVIRLLEILRFYKPLIREEQQDTQKGCEISSFECDRVQQTITSIVHSDSSNSFCHHKLTADSVPFTAGRESIRNNDHSRCSNFSCSCFKLLNNQGCDFKMDQNGESAIDDFQPNSVFDKVVPRHTSSATTQRTDCKTKVEISNSTRLSGGRHKRFFNQNSSVKSTKVRQYTGNDDPNSLWGVIFVEKRYAAYILNMYLRDMSRYDPSFSFIAPNFIMGQRNYSASCSNKAPDLSETQMEHRKQEEVLRRFRMHETNVLVATSVIEDGVDLPKCNLIVRFSLPQDYKSYAQSKGRAKAIPSRYFLMVEKRQEDVFMKHLGKFRGVEQVLLSRCNGREIPVDEEIDLIEANEALPSYYPNKSESDVHVKLSSAISVVNRYCARLPSDTFTRLVPRCKITITSSGQHQAMLQLPINSPVKETILGPSMQNAALAKLAVALETCKILHRAGELDDNLMPMGKICFQFKQEPTDEDDEIIPEGMPRPGTTKRRQYYNKRIANAFKNCLPQPNVLCRLYYIHMKLSCAIPEEQNIRGRQIYEPSDTPQGFGILVAGEIPEICGFPVFTRSGEVAVKLKASPNHLSLSEEQIDSLFFFHHYTFASVLRLEKYPMCYDHNESENSIMVVPVMQNSGDSGDISIDWEFVSNILTQKDFKPNVVSEEERADFKFDYRKYEDAVVMPWYRNLDQPQYFYVAEICYHLTPQSDFPDDDFETFEKYYSKKYDIKIMNFNQPLLDVDHTSARLNLLTPRYVNRKGVALPTISEETKKAKRESLQQKQILIPELCIIHPFSASLWRKAVCLPCILYRLNCLLLADELRVEVAKEIGLGKVHLDGSFQWPPLDFGWGLSDVIKRQKQSESSPKTPSQSAENKKNAKKIKRNASNKPKSVNETNQWEKSNYSNSLNDDFSIGTWSNDMAFDETKSINKDIDFEFIDEEIMSEDFMLDELVMLNESEDLISSFKEAEILECEYDVDRPVRYGSPSNFEINGWDMDNDDVGQIVKRIPGFGFISAPGGFNMEDLSRDLEALDVVESNAISRNYRRNVDVKSRVVSKNRHNESLEDETEDEDFENEEENLDADDDEDYEGEVEYWQPVRSNKTLENNPNLSWTSSGENDWDVSFSWEEVDYNNLLHVDGYSTLFERKNVNIRIVEANQCLLLERVKSVQEQIGGVTNAHKIGSLSNGDVNHSPEQQSVQTSDKETDGCVKNDDCDNNFFTSAINNKEDTDTNKYTTTSFNIASKAVIFNSSNETLNRYHNSLTKSDDFSFDYQPDLSNHPGPSPSLILQALTMSNANDGINLERLETIGDSFLKHAITTYLFCTYPAIHEGKLSHLRSKQVSNLKLYRLGRRKNFAHSMVATKFEPNDNWLPPGYVVPKALEQALIDSGIPAGYWNIARLPDLAKWRDLDATQIRDVLSKHEEEFRQTMGVDFHDLNCCHCQPKLHLTQGDQAINDLTCFIPYNLMSQHSIPDKSIADCVEALIGAYLTSCGQRGALLLMSWLGIDILPKVIDHFGKVTYGYLNLPSSPLQRHLKDWKFQLDTMLVGYDLFEERLGYKFRDRSYLLQAFTHASYHYNRLTDCYQRLEFLGDAVLDYLITRHLYEDKRQHSPGTLTDLRSALVNNTIFATLAVRYDFHKYFKAFCPNLFLVIDRFVRMQKENNHKVNEEYYFIEEDECEEVEDIEVPKALGDVFESLAGAIYLDSGMSLDTVWKVYFAMMKPEIDLFSASVPKSPIRELLEKEPETAKFGKPERTLDGKVRVTVEVFGKGRFTALGRNYRIAKCTAAKHALKALQKLKHSVFLNDS